MKIVNNVNSCPTRGMASGFLGALALGFALTTPPTGARCLADRRSRRDRGARDRAHA